MSATGQQALARWSLRANATFSIASALTLTVFSSPLSKHFSVAPALLIAVAVGLLSFAATLLAVAAAATINRRVLIAIIAADLGWVLGSAVLIALAPPGLSSVGRWLVIAVAAAVLGFALAQIAGLRRLGEGR